MILDSFGVSVGRDLNATVSSSSSHLSTSRPLLLPFLTFPSLSAPSLPPILRPPALPPHDRPSRLAGSAPALTHSWAPYKQPHFGRFLFGPVGVGVNFSDCTDETPLKRQYVQLYVHGFVGNVTNLILNVQSWLFL